MLKARISFCTVDVYRLPIVLALSALAAGQPFAGRAQSVDPSALAAISGVSQDDTISSASNDDTDPADQTSPTGDQSAGDITDTDNGFGRATSPDALLKADYGRQNLRQQTLDGLRTTLPATEQSPGISAGSFVLRPTLRTGVGFEHSKSGASHYDRTFLRNGADLNIKSDWASHELEINATGDWQKTLSGPRQDDPVGAIDANLRLDIANGTSANLRAGYSLQREDTGSANAISDALEQATVTTFSGGAELTRDLGLIRGTLGVDYSHQTYGDATLADGSTLDQSDRNQNTGTIRGRIGYALSPALIPFIEAAYSRTFYDRHRDSLGYIRDADVYSGKAGIEGDFGEKLRGEISTGYALADIADARLDSISAWTLDAKTTWSPQRGTDLDLGLKTEIEPSTSAGASGSVAYTAEAAMTQEILERLSGKLRASTTWRNYTDASTSRQTVYSLGTGLAYGMTRYVDLTASVDWERTTQKGFADSDTLTAGVGIALKR